MLVIIGTHGIFLVLKHIKHHSPARDVAKGKVHVSRLFY